MSGGGVPKDKSVEKVIWLEDIYNYLYTQKGNDTPPPIFIPHTVMLKYQRPCAWFSSSPEGELIKRADTKELDLHQIKRTFCEGAKQDCVAYYVSYAKGSKGKDSSNIVSTVQDCLTSRPGNRSAKIEYFDDKGLENFLFNRPKENNGIVQKFEEPMSPYNTLIRAYWTPHKLLLQQRVNKNELTDLRVVMNERLATFDGPEHLNSEFDIKSYKLKSRLEAYVESIVLHVKKLLPSAYTLWTMECFFKLSGKNKILFLWCNDLRVFNTNDPPKIEAFLTPPIESMLAPKHKYEKKDLKKEFFKCPCAGFNIDATCDKAGGLFDVSQMKITTYRYMILYHQQQAQIEKDVSIPEDQEYSKMSAYRKRWIEEDEMVKFKENNEVKAFELKSGSLVYHQMQKGKEYVRELTGWEQIPPLPVSHADPLVFKFLSKLAIVDAKVIQAHSISEYSKQDLQDFRRWFQNIVMKEPKFLDKKMKVCDACCIKFNSSADDNMSIEMTKLVVGSPEDQASNKAPHSRTKLSTSAEAFGNYMTASPLLLKSMKHNSSTLPPIGAARSLHLQPRSHTSLGTAESEARTNHAHEEIQPRPASTIGMATTDKISNNSKNSLAADNKSSLSLSSPSLTLSRVKLPSKNVREWIKFFYAEAELRASHSELARQKRGVSPYELPLPFKE